jgi:hypothetical protein
MANLDAQEIARAMQSRAGLDAPTYCREYCGTWEDSGRTPDGKAKTPARAAPFTIKSVKR